MGYLILRDTVAGLALEFEIDEVRFGRDPASEIVLRVGECPGVGVNVAF